MKVGEEIICKYCGANSFLVKKTLMDGWKKIGDVLICSSCSEIIYKLDDEEKSNEILENSDKTKKFAEFLGTESLKRPEIDNKEEKHFCRDCKHYIKHPFLNRCGLYQKEVSPMDDCSSFSTNVLLFKNEK